MPGVDSTGYVQKTVTEIIASINAGYRTVYSAIVNVDPKSRIGQRIALFAAAISEVWELGEVLYNALDPDSATGARLDNLLKLVGLARKPASSSLTSVRSIGTTGTVIAAGKQVSVPGTQSKFTLAHPVTIAAVSAWLPTHAYNDNQFAKNGGNVYRVIPGGGGTSAGAGGPSGTGTDIVDGTVHWRYCGAGDGQVLTLVVATVTGPVKGYAFTITQIDTPVAGWNAVLNFADVELGSGVETDPDARARRALSFSKAAASPLDSIRTEILDQVSGGFADTCVIFENTSDATLDGIPPHAFEAVVEGGDDQSIFDAILRKNPGGIQPYGTTAGTSLDAEGKSHVVAFSRPAEVDIWVQVTLAYDPKVFPSNGALQAQELVATSGNTETPVGKDVVASAISGRLFKDLPGVFDVSQVLIGTSNPPVASTTIVVTPRQRANFDSSRVTIIAAPGSF